MPSRPSVPDPIPEPKPDRKPPRRLWLFGPYVLLLALILGWGGFWFVAEDRLVRGLEERAEALRGTGYVVDVGGRRVEGFPFRLKLVIDDLRIAAPTGWAIAAPRLAGEAYLHDPGHWVLAAENGLTVTRPEGGPIAVKGEALRASVVALARAPWRIVLQGTKLAFTPGPGARPFSLAGAERMELYLKPADTGTDGLVLFRLEGGRAAVGTMLYGLSGPAAVSATLNGRLTRSDAFAGRDWGEAVRAWARAGGGVSGLEGVAAAGKTTIKAQGGLVSVGADGRLVGSVPLEMTRAAPAFSALANAKALDAETANSAAAVAAARAQGETTRLNLVFQAGATTVGPVRIGPSPRVG